MINYLKKNWWKILIKLVLMGAILTFDMLTKIYFSKTTGTIPFIKGFISFRYIQNTGAAFGIFGSQQTMLIAISIIFICFFTYWDITNKDKNVWSTLAYICVISGAIGNLIDRLFLGYVRDFVNFDFVTWGIFNIADTFITIGCVLYAIYFVIELVKQKRKKSDVQN